MLKITIETEYALRCVLCISSKPDRIFRVSEISENRDIPKSFLAKIMQKLVKAGLIESIRGAKGGFLLAKKPSDITLLDIIEIMEGPILVNKCAIDKDKCDMSDVCTIHPVWVHLRDSIEKQLRDYDFGRLTMMDHRTSKPVKDQDVLKDIFTPNTAL